MNKVLLRLAMGFVLLAAISAVMMLANDSDFGDALGRWSAVVSALPLLAVGLSFVIVQSVVRPPKVELLKNLLLAATFLLWGAVQLMPRNLVSKRLGDIVIALYVTDLAWTILTGPVRKNQRAK